MTSCFGKTRLSMFCSLVRDLEVVAAEGGRTGRGGCRGGRESVRFSRGTVRGGGGGVLAEEFGFLFTSGETTRCMMNKDREGLGSFLLYRAKSGFHLRTSPTLKMTTIRRFCCNDLLRFTSVNLDHLTETFNMSFYMTYLARWPDYFHVAEGPGNRIMGYIMGKVEGQGESWHGHVTAVTVAPEYRRQQLAKKLMNLLEDVSDKIDNAYFVDLFVRASNTPAIKMYEKLGYVIYRRVLRYYSGEEDGLDMRKALSRDTEKKSIVPLKRPVTPDELEYD
ncbi:hypothetical protein Patl1_03371 [Pistacia atlantica]|uniref:Uncharacterized protein n=1 Tax=Pistacia atlantica TaxID=434234 RepID=A0ACC1CCM9_9ROSI|nr:hypothetical protein Patl1_03371 [Pistacia atlantica]